MKIFGSKQTFWIVVIVIALIIVIFLLTHKRRWRRKLADLALAEHANWNFGQTKESSSAVRTELSKYWRAAGAPDYGSGQAWSAAFISWLFNSSGAKNKFPYSPSHSTYIRQAIENRKSGKRSGALIGYRPEEKAVRIGDLVCYPRQSGVTYDSNYTYKSHCDIVVDIDRKNNRVVTIGGNVSDSVSKTYYDIDSNGRVITPKVHAILKNRI